MHLLPFNHSRDTPARVEDRGECEPRWQNPTSVHSSVCGNTMAKMGAMGKECSNERSPYEAIGAVWHCIKQFVGIAKSGFFRGKLENPK
ncbi:hypothetical protein TSUD_203530 [Trifolium subterraneum]|uniref:Uncharacterized protein n=1 Tax=Trifolium subterraneum TaxID=3900 RepID=A0A2Z6LHN9_TRISU|nr:hypothetical protein TSUD_203530 [Trifolium subterraneum]